MSSKYNRLLQSTCLPLAVIAVMASGSALAGFEWTPPSKPDPGLMHSEDTNTLPQAHNFATDPMLELEPISTHDMMDEEVEAKKESIENAVAVKVLDNSEEMGMSHEVIEEHVQEAETDPTALSINPYPLENEATTTDTMTPIALPSDEESELAELTVEDVGMPTREPVHSMGAIPSDSDQTFDIIEGFGTEIPMALALTQIVPADYAYSFGDHVNPGTSISWKGGEPWNIVLQDALDPVGVTFEIKGKKIVFNAPSSHQAAQAPMDIKEPMADENKPMMMEESTPSESHKKKLN